MPDLRVGARRRRHRARPGRPGQRVVAPAARLQRHRRCSSADLESRGRRDRRLVDIADTEAVVAACADAALVWIESPTNPALEVADIATIVPPPTRPVPTSSSTTPSRPRCCSGRSSSTSTSSLHSATKYLSGHSDVLMGAVVTRDDELYRVLKGRRDLVGAVPGTLEAWLALRGLRTLHLRVERAQANAQELVRRLADAPGGRGGPLPRLRRDRLDRARPGRAGRRPAHPQRRSCGCTRPAWAASSRRSSGVAAGRPRRRPSPRGSSGSRSGIEDVEDLWTDLAGALDDLA